MSTFDYDWSTRQVLVTGGSGFIGTHLVNRLRAEGAKVRVLDDLSTGQNRWADTEVDFLEASVTSHPDISRAIDECDVVFHLAAMVSIPQCEQAPDACRRVNGPDASLPCLESATPQPVSVYGASKIEAEHAIESMIRSRSLQATCLRFFNIVGPGQRPDLPYAAAIPIFAAAVRADQPLCVFGDGMQTRDFVPVDLAVEAMMRSAATPCNRTLNVATGIQTTLLDIIDMISKACDRPAMCTHTPPRAEDIRHSVGDTTLLQNLLGLPGQWGTTASLRDAVTGVAQHCV
jgi:UDP-glucose 4-epimerase